MRHPKLRVEIELVLEYTGSEEKEALI